MISTTPYPSDHGLLLTFVVQINYNLVKIHQATRNASTKLRERLPGNVMRQLSNGHALVTSAVLPSPGKGFCVQCIRKDEGMFEVDTFCSACVGNTWTCQTCFDEAHNVDWL
jgi:hypothetical protein